MKSDDFVWCLDCKHRKYVEEETWYRWKCEVGATDEVLNEGEIEDPRVCKQYERG